MAIDGQSDEALVRRIRDGEQDVFAVLVERYKRGIANFIGASVRSPSDVADLSQETFLRAYAHLGTFNPQLGKFSTWLYHIARNVVRTHLGKAQRRPATQEIGEAHNIESALPDISREADPAGGVLRAEAEAEVRAALAELPERTRTVLALRYYDNMDYHAIAQTDRRLTRRAACCAPRRKPRCAPRSRNCPSARGRCSRCATTTTWTTTRSRRPIGG